jgi:hypothetical protein
MNVPPLFGKHLRHAQPDAPIRARDEECRQKLFLPRDDEN